MRRRIVAMAIWSALGGFPADAQTTRQYVMPDGSMQEEVIFHEAKPPTDFSSFTPRLRDVVTKHWRPPNLSYATSVGLHFVVDKQGTAYNIEVRQTSGNQMMDSSAVEAVRFTVLPAPPPEASDFVDVDFTLNYVPGQVNQQMNSLEGYRKKADEEIMAGHARQALEHLASGIRIDPTYAPFLNDVSKIVARYVMENVDPKQAMNNFLQSISANKSNENALDKINQLLKPGPAAVSDPAKADAAALPVSPAVADTATVAGIAAMPGQPQLDSGNTSTQLPASPATNQELAQLTAQRNKMERVWKLKEAVAKNPTPENRVLFGQALEQASAFDAAQEQYKAALAKDPQNNTAKLLMQGLVGRKQKREVENAMTISTQFGMMTKEELNNAGVQAISKGQYPNAIGFLEEALKKDPAYPVAKQNLALAYNNYGLSLANDPGRALKMFRRAIYFKPTDTLVANNIKAIMVKLGRDSESFDSHMELGDECTIEQDFIGAAVEFQQALKLKEDPLARAKLADSQKRIR